MQDALQIHMKLFDTFNRLNVAILRFGTCECIEVDFKILDNEEVTLNNFLIQDLAWSSRLGSAFMGQF